MAKASDLESSKILLVDDDEVLQQLLQEFLTHQGYTVFVLTKGEELAEYLSLNLIDVIVMDILLPGESGLHWLASLSNKLCNTFFIGRRAEPALHRT